MAAAKEVHGGEVRKARRPDLAAIGPIGAVRHEIDAELAFRRLDRGVNLPRGHVVSLGIELEVVDERLHRGFHLAAARRHHLVVFDRDRSLLGDEPFATLLHDAHRLTHLIHAHEVAVVTIAVLADRDIEFELVIAFVRLALAQVPGCAGPPDHDAGEAAAPRILELHHADIDVALLEDAVVGEEIFDVVADFEEGMAEGIDIGDELRGKILMNAARTEIGRVHAASRGPLVEHHQLLAFLEAPQRRRERTHIQSLGRDVEKMRQEPADLGIEHADEPGALGHGDADKLLDRERIGVLLVHRRHIVEPVEIGQRLEIGLVLDQLLGAAMEQADMRIDPLDHLAVELEHEPEHAVGGRMLRAEIDGELALVPGPLAAIGVHGRSLGVGHHASAPLAALARLASTPRLNRSQATMKRSCVPAPISSTPSWATSLKRARGPLTSIHSASTVTVKPIGVAALCDISICVPRLPSPWSRCGSSSLTQVHSINPTMKPVAKTSGMTWSSLASG